MIGDGEGWGLTSGVAGWGEVFGVVWIVAHHWAIICSQIGVVPRIAVWWPTLIPTSRGWAIIWVVFVVVRVSVIREGWGPPLVIPPIAKVVVVWGVT